MIAGHKKQRAFLKKLIEKDKLPHALIFSGEEQLGKKQVALEAAEIALKGHLEDFIPIYPEGKEITVSQIRDLVWKLSLKAPLKIALIDNCHLMNQEAQNAFLKTLEEPKGNSAIFLITAYPEMLLKTIVSRTQSLKFFPVSHADLKQLSGSGVVSVDMALNRPGRLVELSNNKEKLEEVKDIASKIEEIEKGDLSFRFQYAKEIADKEKAKDMLEVWLSYFRKKMLSNTKDFKKIKKIINLIQSTNYWISSTNVSPKLALEILMMEI